MQISKNGAYRRKIWIFATVSFGVNLFLAPKIKTLFSDYEVTIMASRVASDLILSLSGIPFNLLEVE